MSPVRDDTFTRYHCAMCRPAGTHPDSPRAPAVNCWAKIYRPCRDFDTFTHGAGGYCWLLKHSQRVRRLILLLARAAISALIAEERRLRRVDAVLFLEPLDGFALADAD